LPSSKTRLKNCGTSRPSLQLTKDIYSDLTPWQITKIARHAERPYTLDYIDEIFTHFVELHGDRHFADDLSIVGGLARFNGTPCMVLGQQKGRDTKERGLRNFGMSKPEGYRKALRLMKLAEKFRLPVFTFVDTPGAYPGIDAEERGQSEAIGRNIFEMAQLEVPIITTIIGEGGSGGALAISVADQVLMPQYSIYSVISPEGCASILWKTSDRAQEAAEALGITAHRLKAFGLVDKIINEPVGGAHRDHKQMAAFVKRALTDELLDRRYERLQSYGRFIDTKAEAGSERSIAAIDRRERRLERNAERAEERAEERPLERRSAARTSGK
jgi:acetyl-CoA carboxylase carboxyl transferase subunit alpha